ncbi:MAG: hypothetical protein HC779_08455 [Phyllobacteriaceae bacterium]|nr:hypothetical protein [Phyllobacteriaceae bacterium]
MLIEFNQTQADLPLLTASITCLRPVAPELRLKRRYSRKLPCHPPRFVGRSALAAARRRYFFAALTNRAPLGEAAQTALQAAPEFNLGAGLGALLTSGFAQSLA